MDTIRFVIGSWLKACAALALLVTLASVTEANAATLETAWNSSSCAGCHGQPTYSTDAGAPYNNNLKHLSERFTTAWCAAGHAGAGTTMCSSYGAYISSPGTTDLDAVYNYLVAARDTVIAVGSAAADTVPAFSASAVGATDSKTLTITNYRDEALDFAPSISANGSDFSVVNGNCATTATAGRFRVGAASSAAATPSAPGTCNLTVSFHPVQGSATQRTGTLGISFTAYSTIEPRSRAITLNGSVNPALYGFTAAAVGFEARVGDSSGSGPVKVGRIQNTGSATLSTVISPTSTTPSPGATFQLETAGAGACVANQSLAQGAFCDMYVSYSTTAHTSTSATFAITASRDVPAVVFSSTPVTLTGKGIWSQISPAGTVDLPFGSVQQGVAKTLPFVLNNTGDADLRFIGDPASSVNLTGSGKADYIVGGNCSVAGVPVVLVKNTGTCTLGITFTPSVQTARPAILTLNSDAPNGPLMIKLTGIGDSLPAPTVVYPSQVFPDTVIGDTPTQTRDLIITNPRVRAITYALADTADFKVVGDDCTARVVPGNGGSCIVKVQFRPAPGAGEGLRSATLQVTFTAAPGDNDPSVSPGQVSGMALWPLGRASSSLSPSSVVHVATTASVLLTNRSATSLTLSRLAFSGAAGADYVLDGGSECIPGFVLPGTRSCVLTVRFTPSAVNPREGVLTITHGALGSPQTIDLHGTGLPAPQGRIELSINPPLTFADTQLGSAAALSITVHNAGDAALRFSGFTLEGTQPSEFTRGGTCDTGTPLQVGPATDPATSCTLIVTFRPGALGLRSASLTLRSDASNDPFPIALGGNGVPVPAPRVSLTPTLVFGSQTVGGLYPARSVTLKNTGTADLVPSSISVTGAGFAGVSATACLAALPPGASCDFAIGFAPTVAETDYTGTLRVASNAPGSPHSTALTGRGTSSAVPVLVWSTAVSQLDFGQVSAGTVSAVQSVTLVNNGPGGVLLTVLNAVGADAAAFSVGPGTCPVGTPLFPGTSCRIDIGFAPGSAGAKTASLQIASTGSFPPTLALNGTGLGGSSPGLALSATALSFGATRVGAQSLPVEVTLSGTGSGVVTVTGVGASGPYLVANKSCASVPFTLPAGSSCTVTVMFQPQGEGDATGVLRISNDTSPSVRELALSGKGQRAADVSSGGGCSIASGETLADPTLWALGLLALAALLYRHRARATQQRGAHQGRDRT